MADIVDTAMSLGRFTSLVSFLKNAGLIDKLRDSGPFTVFAPDDDAFHKVPEETINILMTDMIKLKAVLTYHVVNGKLMAADITSTKRLMTLEGRDLKVDASRWHGHNLPKVNDAQIIQVDVMADNGVIHVVNKVLIPKMDQEIQSSMTATTS
jgi:uncharacterized surface protein with fasciclin (FAS1) repeats